jgi:hypothetical protein
MTDLKEIVDPLDRPYGALRHSAGLFVAARAKRFIC